MSLGTNEVVLAVIDSTGNTAYATNTVVVADVTAPVITLNGANPLTVECHGLFTNPGASAKDNCGGGVAVTASGVVNPNVPGSYPIEYRATDAAGNAATNTRFVNVVDSVAPTLTVLGANPATNECHVTYTDAGAAVGDACAGSVSVSTKSDVNEDTPGVYAFTYTANDGNGNTNIATRIVYVVDTVARIGHRAGRESVHELCFCAVCESGRDGGGCVRRCGVGENQRHGGCDNSG